MYNIDSCCNPTAMRRHYHHYVDNTTGSDIPTDYRGTFRPRVDIFENSENLFMEFEMPGIVKDDIKVLINDEGLLSVEAKKKGFDSTNEIKFVRNERNFGDIRRSFILPANIDRNIISAKLENGILSLTLKKNKPDEQVVEIK